MDHLRGCCLNLQICALARAPLYNILCSLKFNFLKKIPGLFRFKWHITLCRFKAHNKALYTKETPHTQIWKTHQRPQDGKRSVFIPILKKGNAKECSNYQTIALISHASKVMLKILQARLQQYVNQELPDVQAGFRKGKGTRDQIANILGS